LPIRGHCAISRIEQGKQSANYQNGQCEKPCSRFGRNATANHLIPFAAIHGYPRNTPYAFDALNSSPRITSQSLQFLGSLVDTFESALLD
jgi:hypothetical protein